MTELEKHIIWLEGTAQALVASGLLDAPVSITPKGTALYEQLVVSGWRPQARIVKRLLRENGVPPEQLDGAIDLFMSHLSDDTD